MSKMEMFDAKADKKPVRIGICKEGISVFNDQLRTHRFTWQIMKQLEVQRKTFTIKLKKSEEYEGTKKLSFKLEDKAAAKSCWEKAVEAHTSFLKPGDVSHQPIAQESLESSLSRSQINDDIPTAEPKSSPICVTTNSGKKIVIDHVEVPSSPLLPNDSAVPPQSPTDLNETLSSVHTCYSSVTPIISPKHSYGCNDKGRNIFDDEQENKNQIVSSNVVEAGDRVIETTTYKTIKDGILQTKVEHQVKITDSEMDQKAAILKALEDATGLHANNEAKKTEVKVERSPSMF